MKPTTSILDRFGRAARAALFAAAFAAAAASLFAAPAAAQYFIPFYGKNKVKYDRHDWQVYRSPHFDVYYYPEMEEELGRLVSYAESAYETISDRLKHEIPFAIPLILYRTFSEFAQTNLSPSEIPEGVGAFAESARDRMVIPIDNPPDELQELFLHELTHIFEFDIVPRSLFRQTVPLWIDEGLATYMEDEWDPLDLMVVRDAAVADQVPTFAELNQAFTRTPYSFGASIFDFMEERFGEEGVRQFVFSLRRAVTGGVSEEVYEQAFRMAPEEFYREYKRWIKERFKPYRDKEIPEDYSVDLSPREGRYVGAISAAHSPSGEVIAVLAGNRRETEYDVVLLSAKDGEVIRNLTPGYAGEFINVVGLTGEDQLIGRNLSWTPDGSQVAFFGKFRKRRALLFADVVDSEIVRRIEMPLDRAKFPQVGPDGDWVYFSALRNGIADIYRIDLATEEIENLTKDDFHDKFPTVSPDGEWLYYSRRISGYDKLYRLRIATGEKEQITFGTFHDVAPIFAPNGRDLVYSSNEDDGIFNIRTLDTETGDIIQYTDVLGGNFAPSVMSDPETGQDTLLFTSYHKGNWGLHTLAMDEPVKEIMADTVIRTPGPVIDFVPTVDHQVISENKRKKSRFERLFLDGPPPIQAGVTSDGDFFGGTAISFSDVLGDDRFSFTAYSVRSFRVYNVQYANLSGRFQYAVEGHDNTSFFYPRLPYYYGSYWSRRDRLGTIRSSGASVRALYPLSRFRRLEMGIGYDYQSSGFQNPFLTPGQDPTLPGDFTSQYADFYQRVFPTGHLLPTRFSFVQETIRFRQVGPAVFPQAGSTVLAGVEWSPGGPFLSRTTFNLDARKYFQVTTASVLAARLKWFHSAGEAPGFFWFGGNGELRGYPLYSFSGNRGGHATVEFRFPIIDAAITPIGLVGPLRGSVFVDAGGAAYAGDPLGIYSTDRRESRLGNLCGPRNNSACVSEGFGLDDFVASYGFNARIYLLGLPLNFAWSRRTDFSTTVPGWKFDFWMGWPF